MFDFDALSRELNEPDVDRLIAIVKAAQEFEEAVSLNMIAGGRVAPMEQAVRLMDDVRRTHRKLRDAFDSLHKAG